MKIEEKGSGWIVFASIMPVIAGICNVTWGITTLAKDELLVSQVLFANLTFWGWFYFILGIVAVIAGFAVPNKAQWARWFGIIVASLSAIFAFMAIWAYPVWAIMIIALDVMVIYGLAGYRGYESAV